MDNHYWNSLAKTFEDDVLEISQKDFRNILKKEISSVSGSRRVAADLGCGTGSLLKLLSPQFKKVYAIDYAEDLLKKAEARSKFKNVEYRVCDLINGKAPLLKADVTFCVNALLTPCYDQRQKFAYNVRRATKKNGLSIFVVPAMESIMNTYHTMMRCTIREGQSFKQSLSAMRHLYAKEVIDPVAGIVNVGGEPTKCYTEGELVSFLEDVGYVVQHVSKIFYPWTEEMDNPPKWLKDPYPWDWLICVK